MQIIRSIDDIRLTNTAVTLGKFNGLHKGHQKLISRVINERQNGLLSVVFSFDTGKIKKNQSLTTDNDKILLCEKMGADVLVLFPVSEETMRIQAHEFIKDILIDKMDAKMVVSGVDFRFGKDKVGNVEMLKKESEIYGYSLYVEDTVIENMKKISSTDIRRVLQSGDIEAANEMLGYDYFIRGRIVRGLQIGRTIDKRTINLEYEKDKILPMDGVYATEVCVSNKWYKSITNIGTCPTVSENHARTVETHLLNFDSDIYGEEVILKIKGFIRNEKKFETLDELKKQIEKDIKFVERVIF